jgi:hypothetical protein
MWLKFLSLPYLQIARFAPGTIFTNVTSAWAINFTVMTKLKSIIQWDKHELRKHIRITSNGLFYNCGLRLLCPEMRLKSIIFTQLIYRLLFAVVTSVVYENAQYFTRNYG